MRRNRYVAWVKGFGESGLGSSMAIGEPEAVEAEAVAWMGSARWLAHNPRGGIVTITSDPIRQRIVKVIEVPAPAPILPSLVSAPETKLNGGAL